MLPFFLVAHGVVESHLHVWDETAARLDPGPMRIGYGAQSTASVEFFMDAGRGYVRNRDLLPREAMLRSKEKLELVMGGTAERL